MKRRWILATQSLGIVVACFCDWANAADLNICEREMQRASERYDVPLGVLYAVGMTETGNKGSLQPFALNVEGRTVIASSAEAAMTEFKHARDQGAKLIDLGCMQINHHYHGAEFSSVSAMLVPADNVAYAAKFLRSLYKSQGSWTMAVARYHAGPGNDPAQKKYVCMVIANLVAAGFGNWTPEAKSFCRKPA